jgi:hypothetical protein
VARTVKLKPKRRLGIFARLVVSGVVIEAVIATFRFRNTCELGFASPMTVSSVAPEEIVTIILRLLVDGTEVFRSFHQ